MICIKMDLALNNPQRLIGHKTQTTNQPINQPEIIWFQVFLCNSNNFQAIIWCKLLMMLILIKQFWLQVTIPNTTNLYKVIWY